MQIVLPNATLLEDDTIIACDDPTNACTYFNFQIKNTGTSIANAAYSIRDAVTGYLVVLDYIYNLAPGETSTIQHGPACALPGEIPLGQRNLILRVQPTTVGIATDTYTEPLNVIEEPIEDMQIVLPNANGKLFLSNTITACDEPADACTEFRFQIRNDGNTSEGAWYKVSIVGGGTLYESSISALAPGGTSVVIDDLVCALPGGLPVGTHTIKVEVGPTGQAATDSVTDTIYVIEETELPTVTSQPGSDITQSSATLNGNLTSTGGISTLTGFEYGKTTSYGTTVWYAYQSTTGSYSKSITGLTSNTTYHFRAIVTNDYGTGYGVDKTFTTLEEPPPPPPPPPGAPVVATWQAENVTQSYATLRGSLWNPDALLTHIGFEYGKTTSYGTTVWDRYASSPGYHFDEQVLGLEANTLYHYRAIATNDYGTGYGVDITFTTLEELFNLTFIATAPGISDLHNVDVTDTTDPLNHIHLGTT